MDEQVTVQKLIDQGFSKYRAESMSELSNELTKEGFKCISEGIPVLNGGQLLNEYADNSEAQSKVRITLAQWRHLKVRAKELERA